MRNEKKSNTKASLVTRRRWLQSSVAAVALPSLEILMSTKVSAQQSAQNFLVYYVPNGRLRAGWNPSKSGSSIRFPNNSAAMNPWANRIAAGSMGIQNKPANSSSPGAAHAIACTTSMTGRKGNFSVGRSTAAKTFDQYVADKIGGNTRFKSLQYTSGEPGVGDRTDNGAASIFTQCISWASSSHSLSPNTSLRSAFDQLFGANSGFTPPTGGNPAAPTGSLPSILDALTKDASRLKNALGTSDQQRLEQYFEGLRDIERRIQTTSPVGSASCDPSSYDRRENGFEQRVESWNDLMVLALQCGQTKVISYMIDWELAERKYDFNPVNASRPNHGNSLLDETLVLVQPGFGQGAGHDWRNVIPLLIGGDGRIKTDGRWFRTDDLANVAASVLDVFDIQGNLGANGKRYGDYGTGRINDLFSNNKP